MPQHWTDEFFSGQYAQEYFATAEDAVLAQRQAAFIAIQLRLDGSQRVLDLCCGSGRHAVALAQHASAITGVDRTELYLAAGRARIAELGIGNVELMQGDMRELDYQGEFEAAYNYFTSWGYYSDEENFDVLRRLWRALKPGGRFLLETIFRDTLMGSYRPQGYRESEDGTVLLEERWFDFATGRSHNRRLKINSNGTRSEIRYDHYLPTSDALARHLRDAGFSSVSVMEAPTGAELSLNSWRMAAVAVK
jgi:ubiquinone/menaquinone biosynthesis C-methylase UbiE